MAALFGTAIEGRKEAIQPICVAPGRAAVTAVIEDMEAASSTAEQSASTACTLFTDTSYRSSRIGAGIYCKVANVSHGVTIGRQEDNTEHSAELRAVLSGLQQLN